jgi:hypothetical protein
MRIRRRSFYLLIPAFCALAAVGRGSSDPFASDPPATPVWAKSIVNYYGGTRLRDGMPDAAGGGLAVGDIGYSPNLDGWAVHFDKDGALLKQMSYGGSKHDRFYAVCASDDKQYVAAGRTGFTQFGIYDQEGTGLLMKLNADLAPVWTKSYMGLADASYFFRVAKLKTKGYLATMYTWGGLVSGLVVMRLDSAGCVVWARILKADLTYALHEINEILPTSDGGCYLVGSDYTWDNHRKDGLVIKIDSRGDFKWAKVVGGADTFEEFYSAYLTAAGDLMVFGCYYPDFRGAHPLILKISPSGTILWQNLYKKLGYSGFRYGIMGPGAGFCALGYNDGPASVRINYLKADATGKVLSKKGYAVFRGAYPNYYERLVDAFWSSDGGIIALDSDTITNAYIVKMDAAGRLPETCQTLSLDVARSRASYKASDITLPYESLAVAVKAAKLTAKATTFATDLACR